MGYGSINTVTKAFQWKVTENSIDHILDIFTQLHVTGRENGVMSAQLECSNPASLSMWIDSVALFDSIQVAVNVQETGWIELFDGYVKDHAAGVSMKGRMVGLKCRGLGVALADTHCNEQYGYTCNRTTPTDFDEIEEILEDVVDNHVNKSYGSANVTGYAITKTYIGAIDAALKIPFFNAPYQTNQSIVDLLCTLDTAYRDGSTAGPHWIVDVAGNLRIKTIGTTQAEIGGSGGAWGTYYGGQAAVDAAGTLTEGIDFFDYTLNTPSDSYANSVVLACDLRKPAYDYWTEDSGGAALWGNDGLGTLENSVTEYVVGSHSLHLVTDGANNGTAYYPSAENANWDFSLMGSEESVPSLNFYYWMDADIAGATTYVRLFTTDHDNDYFYDNFPTWTLGGSTNSEWLHISIPIGLYWRTLVEERVNRWGSNGIPSWFTMNGIAFNTSGAGGNGDIYIDDLHFSGKVIREAVDTSEVTSYNEHQHVIMSRTPLDDSFVATDDSGMAGQLCHAELLRRVNPPKNLTVTVSLKPSLKAGEYFKIYAGRMGTSRTGYTYKVNGVDYRTLQYTHHITRDGATTTLYLTSDVTNSFPISDVRARKVLNEYLLENNEKATDMQGGNVDLLIPHLRKTY
jgi:hypothetical protein